MIQKGLPSHQGMNPKENLENKSTKDLILFISASTNRSNKTSFLKKKMKETKLKNSYHGRVKSK